MTEAEARKWLVTTFAVSRETLERLETFQALVAHEQAKQNLIAASTLPLFWSRHLVDSAQLLLHAPRGASWLDIGSGAGFPGVVIAILNDAPILLVEPRPLRATFLRHVATTLGLANVTVHALPLARVASQSVGVITARAVAALPKLIEMADRFADLSTVWILPKGKNAQEELASLPRAWHGRWRNELSVTDPQSRILIGRGRQGG